MSSKSTTEVKGEGSDERIVIEDNGKWGWSLVVEEWVVSASKLIPYDGSICYSTKDRRGSRSSRRRGSQFQLSVEQVVDCYRKYSETELSKQELRARVREAREKSRQ